MATHASHGTFSGKSFAVLACAAAGMSLVILLLMKPTSPGAGKHVVKPEPNAFNDASRYNGSIMVDAPRGDLCLERVFDNRTAKMWDRGYVKCDSGPPPLPGTATRPGNMDVYRLHEVGKAFRHEGD